MCWVSIFLTVSKFTYILKKWLEIGVPLKADLLLGIPFFGDGGWWGCPTASMVLCTGSALTVGRSGSSRCQLNIRPVLFHPQFLWLQKGEEVKQTRLVSQGTKSETSFASPSSTSVTEKQWWKEGSWALKSTPWGCSAISLSLSSWRNRHYMEERLTQLFDSIDHRLLCSSSMFHLRIHQSPTVLPSVRPRKKCNFLFCFVLKEK